MNNELNHEDMVRNDNSAKAESDIMNQACANFHTELFSEMTKNEGATGSHISENAQATHKPENTAAEMKTLQKILNNDPELSKLLTTVLNEWATEEKMKKTGKLDDKTDQALKALELSNSLEGIKGIHFKSDGVDKLSTGDHLIRNNGTEVLVTPKGDTITVKPDGTHEIKGNVQSVTTDKDGATTVTFADGAKVSLDKSGINSVSRGNKSVSLASLDSVTPAHLPTVPIEDPASIIYGLPDTVIYPSK